MGLMNFDTQEMIMIVHSNDSKFKTGDEVTVHDYLEEATHVYNEGGQIPTCDFKSNIK